jgi:hypothetical protein
MERRGKGWRGREWNGMKEGGREVDMGFIFLTSIHIGRGLGIETFWRGIFRMVLMIIIYFSEEGFVLGKEVGRFHFFIPTSIFIGKGLCIEPP